MIRSGGLIGYHVDGSISSQWRCRVLRRWLLAGLGYQVDHHPVVMQDLSDDVARLCASPSCVRARERECGDAWLTAASCRLRSAPLMGESPRMRSIAQPRVPLIGHMSISCCRPPSTFRSSVIQRGQGRRGGGPFGVGAQCSFSPAVRPRLI